MRCAELVEAPLHFLEWHLAEPEAVDLLEAQLLFDQHLQHPAAEVLFALLGPPLHQAQADDLVEVGSQDRVLVDHRHDAVDRLRPGPLCGQGQ